VYVVIHSYKKKSCKQKYNINNKEHHFVNEAQIESKDGLAKPGHLWEDLLISKISAISNNVGLLNTQKKITVNKSAMLNIFHPDVLMDIK
jgi:hypothetical protein